jgi:zinc transport system substrate-binding protein
MKHLYKIISLLFFFVFSNSSLAELNVVASIKPLYGLVTNVSGDKNNNKLLINSVSSPHHYQLRPSDIKMIQNADVIFLIDEHFETFLSRYFAKNKLKAKIVQLSDSKDLVMLRARHKHELINGDHSKEHCHCKHGHKDIHYWSDPNNAQKMVSKIAEVLSDLDPKNKDYYENNSITTSKRLADLDKELESKLAPVKNKNFIVFHDAYQYFEHKYNLSNVGSIVVGNNKNYGAKTISKIQKVIQEKQVVCIFAEPQFSSDVVRNIADAGKIKYNYLDIEWGASYSGLKPEDYYFAMMKSNADNLVYCLS